FGNYTITLTATTVNGCTHDTIVNATLNLAPLLAYPALAPVCENQAGSISIATAPVTNAVPGAGVYSGPGTTAAGIFTPSVAGYGTHTIWYKYTTTAGCKDSISRTILVRARAIPKFTFPAGGCLPVTGLVQFTNNSTIADGQAMSYQWNFNDPNANAGNPNTSTATNPTHIFLEGTYNIQLTITSSGSCVSDTTITATFSRKPALAFPALAPRCQNETVAVSIATATVTNGVAGTGVYSGPGTTSAGLFTPSVAGFGTHIIWYKFTTAGGCADSISQTISVRAKPKASYTFTNPTCLPTTGLVTFTNGSTIVDAQAMNYTWNFNDPNATAGNPNTASTTNATHNFLEGTFNVVLTATTTPAGCIHDTTVAITFSVKPALTFSALLAHCQNETTPVSIATASVTNGVTGTGVYSGPGTDAAGNFTPSIAGFGTHTIWYKFTTAGGCKDSISQTIAVRAKPKAKYTFTNPTCLPTTGLVMFTNSSTIADGQTMNYTWNFNDPNATPGNPNTASTANATHNFLEGTFNVVLTATTTPAGCIADTTIAITFSVKPALTFPALTAHCQNETVPVSIATASVTNGVTGTGVYSGPGTDVAGNFIPSIAGFGTHTIWYKFTTAGGCKDSVSQTIAVRSKPKAKYTFTNPTCLPTTGSVTFTNSSTIADGQTMNYTWNFNDPNATPGNPNTASTTNATHNFLEGTFNVVLTATTTPAGCIGDTTIAITFSVKPALAFTPLSNLCESAASTSIASASVTNGVTGTGVYSGPGTSSTGTFNPSTAGAGTHTIWYKFTTAGGCKDSISRTLVVYPKPISSFTINSDMCLNALATIDDGSTIPTGSITTWNWNFGDLSTANYLNGNTFTRPYAAFGTYIVKLVTISDQGCTSDTARQTIAVHAIPVADFRMPAFVCMPNGSVDFTNQSTAPDNASLIYTWNFGDLSPTSNAVNPPHIYPASLSYNITLRATSSFGCFKDTTKTFDKFFDKPIANFDVTPDNLCQGTPNTFVDNSSAPNSTIQGWDWNFGDGTTSINGTPSKTYTRPGNFTIILAVKNAVGCLSDPFPKNVVVNLQPKVDAGPSFVVPENTVIKFSPIVNDSSVVQFLWTPSSDFSNATLLRPIMPATHNQTYTLTATGPGNCKAMDTMYVKILRPVIVPNAFSPNGDNIHDEWVIAHLSDYPGVTVDVYNRYGQVVYRNVGYSSPWDGTVNGKPLPFATYYYIINLKNGFEPMSGSITIVK
ncbi:MAG: PKD domain-containing protein, partial [Ferruginibacter sp.]